MGVNEINQLVNAVRKWTEFDHQLFGHFVMKFPSNELVIL